MKLLSNALAVILAIAGVTVLAAAVVLICRYYQTRIAPSEVPEPPQQPAAAVVQPANGRFETSLTYTCLASPTGEATSHHHLGRCVVRARFQYLQPRACSSGRRALGARVRRIELLPGVLRLPTLYGGRPDRLGLRRGLDRGRIATGARSSIRCSTSSRRKRTRLPTRSLASAWTRGRVPLARSSWCRCAGATVPNG